MCAQIQAPAVGREMPADAQHELARLGIAVVGPAAPNLVSFPLRLTVYQLLFAVPSMYDTSQTTQQTLAVSHVSMI